MQVQLKSFKVSARERAATAFARFHLYTSETVPPPSLPAERVLYGLAQPLLSLRLLRRDPTLLKAAIEPAVLLALVCTFVALVDPEPGRYGRFVRFYHAFVVLAPVPPVILSRHYARLAARARRDLGFGECHPRYKPLLRAALEAGGQLLLVAMLLGLATGLLMELPAVGKALAATAGALWALHWIVVEALDSARVLRPGQSLADVDAVVASLPAPWFVRSVQRLGAVLPRYVGAPVRAFGGLCERLSRPWREEIALIERHTFLALGFSLSTAMLLAIPGVNLLFRPIIVIASAHLLGHLEAGEAHGQSEAHA